MNSFKHSISSCQPLKVHHSSAVTVINWPCRSALSQLKKLWSPKCSGRTEQSRQSNLPNCEEPCALHEGLQMTENVQVFRWKSEKSELICWFIEGKVWNISVACAPAGHLLVKRILWCTAEFRLQWREPTFSWTHTHMHTHTSACWRTESRPPDKAPVWLVYASLRRQQPQ